MPRATGRASIIGTGDGVHAAGRAGIAIALQLSQMLPEAHPRLDVTEA